MVNIVAVPLETKEKTVPLSSLKPGDVFRFAETSFEKALECDDGACFYQVTGDTPKEERVPIRSLDGKSCTFARDKDRMVVQHNVTIQIHPADHVPVT